MGKPEELGLLSLYQAAVERMQQGLLLVDAQGTIAFANLRIAVLLATLPERLAGMPLSTIAVAESEPALRALMKAAHAQAEVRLRRGPHESFDALVAVSTVDEAHKLCLVSDLTLQKRREASEERTRKFLAMMAHEFRNILSPIRTAAEALERGAALDDDARRAVQIIQRNTARLVALIEDLRRINPRE